MNDYCHSKLHKGFAQKCRFRIRFDLSATAAVEGSRLQLFTKEVIAAVACSMYMLFIAATD